MKAVLQKGYGPPEILRVGEVERPIPQVGELLVRVHASTVTRADAMGVRGVEYRFTRLFTGIRRPRRPVRGTEFAGVVEAIGSGVTEFEAGDEVFGVSTGANAEFVTVKQDGVVAARPQGLSMPEAAAVPDGALLALTCLAPAAPLAGKRVLVYGAAGSVGSSAVQLLLHHFGAGSAAAVCDTKDVDFVRSLGVERVFDRFQEDFTKAGETWDVVFDAVGKHSFRRCRKVLSPKGIYVSMDLGYMYHLPPLALITRLARGRRATVGIGRYRKADLLLVKGLIETGKYRPIVDRTYPLDDVVAATAYVESGQKRGSVVLVVVPESGH